MSTLRQASRRVVLYVRVSTTRQADGELSILDQIKQGQDYCAARGLELVETFTEPGASATDDRRPEFQRMIDAATFPERPFDTILVHSMSRFFREQYLSEMYIHRLRKAGATLISITQEFNDNPTGNLIRQVLGSFDEYQSRENAKHTLRAMQEKAGRASGTDWCRRSVIAPSRRRGAGRRSRRCSPSTKPRRKSSAASSTSRWAGLACRLVSRQSSTS
jgi:DNA invertase Pin-like site-specific DNA recombinase